MSLVLTSAPLLSLAELNNALSGALEPLRATASVTTSSGRLAAGELGRSGTFNTIVSLAASPGHHTVALLGVLAAALKPGGRLIVKERGGSEAVKKQMLLSGLVVSSNSSSGDSDAVEAQKPSWETGTRAAISLRSKPAATAAAPAAAAKAWTLADLDGADELVDDEELLLEEDKARPPAPPAKDDCEVGASGRKACKNCTCGRADGNAPEVKLTVDMLENPQPSGGCGSCALGDAFRCAGCPYKGLPAFEYGKPIKVSADFLAVDI